MDTSTIEDGDTFRVEWRVYMYGNAAERPYYTIDIDMFAHTFPDGERVLLVTQDWLDEHPNTAGSGARCRGYARNYADGVHLNPDHPHIESMTPV